ncbi:MAG: MBL fold metallo-hydrolase [Deltaproteobacteria bacterium]|nr:MBL fold metallo-hydrolase [Deltaproteobacteria bacterium]MDQ3299062.1 MBL fold metallo-hydrolase [Myxococcota bacterium]
MRRPRSPASAGSLHLGPLGHLAAGAAYLATARRQQRSDQTTATQLAWPTVSPLPPGLELTWIGTAGFRIAYQGTVIWIDPYVTRLSFGSLVRRRIVPPSADAVARWIDRADAVLVGHTHFDHALDVPEIARRFGCPVYGSTSLAHLMQLHGLAERAVVVEPRRSYEVGPFRFHFVPSVHSKLQLGLGIPYSGELTCDHVDELIPQAYKCGQVWGIAIEVAGWRLYHQGSADLLEDEIVDRGVDAFLCGISGRRFTPRYVERVVRALDPKLIVATHFDDFFRPLDAPSQFSFNVNLTGFADEAHRAARDVPVHTLEVGKRV